MVGSLIVVLGFQHSARLANAYGVAVCMIMVLTTICFSLVMKICWKFANWKIFCFLIPMLVIDTAFLSANLEKIATGGWIPLTFAASMSVVMIVWQMGRELLFVRSHKDSVPIPRLKAILDYHPVALSRYQGIGLFFTREGQDTPSVVLQVLSRFRTLPRYSMFVNIRVLDVPFIGPSPIQLQTLNGMREKMEMMKKMNSAHRDDDDDDNKEVEISQHLPPHLVFEEFGNGLFRAVVSFGYAQTHMSATDVAEAVLAEISARDKDFVHFLDPNLNKINIEGNTPGSGGGKRNNLSNIFNVTPVPVTEEEEFILDFGAETSDSDKKRAAEDAMKLIELGGNRRFSLTYFVGRDTVIPLPDTNRFHRFVLGFYNFLVRNSREFSDYFEVPHSELIEIGLRVAV